MFGDKSNSPMMECGTQAVAFKNPTLTEQLQAERNRLVDRLADVDKAIEALTANPGVQEAVDAIARLGNYR